MAPRNSPLIVLAEKVLMTWVQAFITVLMLGAGDTIFSVSVLQAAAIAALPAALTVVANGIPIVPPDLPFYVDLALRTIRTYVAAFLGLLLAQPVFRLDYSVGLAAATGAMPAALAVIKGTLASRVGDHNTAALLP